MEDHGAERRVFGVLRDFQILSSEISTYVEAWPCCLALFLLFSASLCWQLCTVAYLHRYIHASLILHIQTHYRYIHIYICIYTYTYAYTDIDILVSPSLCSIFVCMISYICMYVCMHVHAYMHVCMLVCGARRFRDQDLEGSNAWDRGLRGFRVYILGFSLRGKRPCSAPQIPSPGPNIYPKH